MVLAATLYLLFVTFVFISDVYESYGLSSPCHLSFLSCLLLVLFITWSSPFLG
jgi:hypothetical protein